MQLIPSNSAQRVDRAKKGRTSKTKKSQARPMKNIQQAKMSTTIRGRYEPKPFILTQKFGARKIAAMKSDSNARLIYLLSKRSNHYYQDYMWPEEV